jgi:hypothetical protein
LVEKKLKLRSPSPCSNITITAYLVIVIVGRVNA